MRNFETSRGEQMELDLSKPLIATPEPHIATYTKGNKPHSPIPDKPIVVSLRYMLDKFAGIFPVENDLVKARIDEYLSSPKRLQKYLGENIRCFTDSQATNMRRTYYHSISVTLDGGDKSGPHINFSWKPKPYIKNSKSAAYDGYLRIELNPSRWAPSQLGALRKLLVSALGKEFSLSVRKAHATRADIAIDFLEDEFPSADYAIYVDGINNCREKVNDETGDTTQYWGSFNSSWFIRSYTKVFGEQRIRRIEYVLKKRQIPLRSFRKELILAMEHILAKTHVIDTRDITVLQVPKTMAQFCPITSNYQELFKQIAEEVSRGYPPKQARNLKKSVPLELLGQLNNFEAMPFDIEYVSDQLRFTPTITHMLEALQPLDKKSPGNTKRWKMVRPGINTFGNGTGEVCLFKPHLNDWLRQQGLVEQDQR
jgi:hypothetical protein